MFFVEYFFEFFFFCFFLLLLLLSLLAKYTFGDDSEHSAVRKCLPVFDRMSRLCTIVCIFDIVLFFLFFYFFFQIYSRD